MVLAPSLPVESAREADNQIAKPPGPRPVTRKSERAQNLVEFALVLPLLLVLVLAAIDFGWALRSYIKATNSAREGARYGAVGSNADTIKQRVVEASGNMLTTSNVDVKGAGGQTGNGVQVDVHYTYQWITPLGKMLSVLSGGTLPDPLPIATSANMRLE